MLNDSAQHATSRAAGSEERQRCVMRSGTKSTAAQARQLLKSTVVLPDSRRAGVRSAEALFALQEGTQCRRFRRRSARVFRAAAFAPARHAARAVRVEHAMPSFRLFTLFTERRAVLQTAGGNPRSVSPSACALPQSTNSKKQPQQRKAEAIREIGVGRRADDTPKRQIRWNGRVMR